MKKKIKDLTREERLSICDKYVYNECKNCPFCIDKIVHKTCVHAIINVLEREVEIDE